MLTRLLCFVCCLLLLGCGKEAPVIAPAAPANQVLSPSGRAGFDGVSWESVGDWVTARGTGMRFATLTGPAGDDRPEIAVSTFDGDAGGVRANVNRWRGQVGLDPVREEDLPSATTPIEAGDAHGVLVDVTGTAADSPRMLAVILPHGEATWFFKMTGPREKVARRREDFVRIVASVRWKPEGGK